MGLHRFQNYQFDTHKDQSFKTKSTILVPSHYEPIILFLGTHNDDNVPDNQAEFFNDVLLGNLRHPRRNVSFRHGDVLEPRFLRDIDKEDLESVVEQVLDVQYRYNT